ncbi:hypothetical protein SAMD00019534_085560 [Acytostelium subglobosum LB1]|uniref:hypothetical protein n=1 Tax=Acytostelium subglobosum LB1 TaxID=1410327 RepID=UPI000644B2E4|nr:hypothetical protein SAMD00019534_085560 [Acytostelium subglobosum LB1]GAM25381.1 hypothetical protein SAMD00019534_085560 [Acytostelium subglobosum LB1]|eukprot:XP_012751901.1 hypothetical protein SAMD00019534_085560 [Acytostelium subglobosum LB1]
MVEHIPLFYTDTTNELLTAPHQQPEHQPQKDTNNNNNNNNNVFDDEYFQIQTSIDTIAKFGFKRVALQLPDSLLWAGRTITAKLVTAAPQCKVFILGDTSYGNCCVDEVTASHLKADFIIHYGHSCLSPATKLPVQYVFGRKQFDVDTFVTCFRNKFSSSDKVIIFYDLPYHFIVPMLREQLPASDVHLITDIDSFNNIYYSQSFINNKPTSTANCDNNNNTGCCNNSNNNKDDTDQGCCGGNNNGSSDCCSTSPSSSFDTKLETETKSDDLIFGRKLSIDHKDIEQYTILWIGEECVTLTNLLMNFNKNTFYSYTDNKIQQVTLTKSQSLMKRYYISNKCKDANIIGIVVATLTVQKYSETIERLRKLILEAGKKPYVFVVGRLNVPKLANFSEIDIFVAVACPENTIIDSKEYFKPIATPFELNLALRGQEWTGQYITDFGRLFPHLVQPLNDGNQSTTRSDVERDEDDVSDEEGNRYHFSLSSGKIVKFYNASAAASTTTSNTSGGEMVSVDDKLKQLSTATNASEYFVGRTYRGLETRIGETEVTKAITGMSGIPMGYNTDKESTTTNQSEDAK